MQLVQDLRMHCYRLHLRFVALCQSISLEPPYYTKIDIQVTPIDGGGAGSRTPVFPPLLLIVNN